MKRLLLLTMLFASAGAMGQGQVSRPAGDLGQLASKRFPGGRDESDLTVQPLRKIQKPVMGEPDHFEPEAPEYDATSSDAGFGE